MKLRIATALVMACIVGYAMWDERHRPRLYFALLLRRALPSASVTAGLMCAPERWPVA